MTGLNLEEILVQRALDEELLEVPLSEKVFKTVFLIGVVLSAFTLIRVFSLGVVHKSFYAQRSFTNANQIIVLNPLRGIVFDRFGEPLVQNESVFNLILIPSRLPRDPAERDGFFGELASILGVAAESFSDQLNAEDLERFDRISLMKFDDPRKMIELEALEFPAIQIENDYRRVYPDGEVFSHLLGYVGAMSEADLAANPDLYPSVDIGKTGLEAFYDAGLRGVQGELVKLRDVRGNFLAEKLVRQPEPGDSLETNIDAGLQRYLHSALKAGLNRVGSRAGVGIAIDPRNGEVLALASFPSFDNNVFSRADADAVGRILNDKTQPLFNRAVSGMYNPGSVIKPLVAAAALAENVIDTRKEIFSAGFIEIPNPYNPDQPSRFLDWKPHGWVNLYSALARSSNVYFYSVGGGFDDVKGLGISRLIGYWRHFGLGNRTGIDLTGEKPGFLPAPDEKEERTGAPWRLGDTYNVSIGQGDLLITPIQLINYIAAVANGGYLYQPGIARGETGLSADLSFLGDQFREVEKGMIDAVEKPYGTAYSLSDLPMKVAAKTGSAQVYNNTKLNAFFVGYAPVPDPQIAVLVLVEDAREGGLNAVPVAKDVLMWYYENRLKD